MKEYTVVCGGFPLVTIKVQAGSESEAIKKANEIYSKSK